MSDPGAFPNIQQVDPGNGDLAFVTELPTAPFGSATFVTGDHSLASKELLHTLSHHWPSLWPEILGRLQEQIAGYKAPHDLTRDEFIGFVSPMTPGAYMADCSDTHLRLDLDEPPLWDIFLKGPAIAHFQAVF